MISDEMQVDILMKEYSSLREEVMIHFKNAKLHLKHFQVFIAAVFAIGSFLITNQDKLDPLTKVMGISKTDLLLYAILAAVFVSYYFAFDILDSYFCMYLAAARLANIEEQVNNTWGRNLLIWESKFQSQKVAAFGPSRFIITAYQIVLVFVISVALPFYSYSQLGKAHDLAYPEILTWARWG